MANFNARMLEARRCHKAGHLDKARSIYLSAGDFTINDPTLDVPAKIDRVSSITDELYTCQGYLEASILLDNTIPVLEVKREYGKCHPKTIELYLDLLRCYKELGDSNSMLFTLSVLLPNISGGDIEEESMYGVEEFMEALCDDWKSQLQELKRPPLRLMVEAPIFPIQSTERSGPSSSHLASKPTVAQEIGGISALPRSARSTPSYTPIMPSPETIARSESTVSTLGNQTFHTREYSRKSRSREDEQGPNAASQSGRVSASLATSKDRIDPSAEESSSSSRQQSGTMLGDSEGLVAHPYSTRSAMLSDRWFNDLVKLCHPVLEDERYAATSSTAYPRIRIAILDTGIEFDHADTRPKLVTEHHARIKECKSFESSSNAGIDTNGHGTHVAMLALRTFPNADLYIAKVSATRKDFSKSAVIRALKWAASKQVDIINMSFGWTHIDTDELESTLSEVRGKGILLFAATSNDGLRKAVDIAYPANSRDVIGIDCANGAGVSTEDFNPPSNTMNRATWRFTAPGEAVESAFPTTRMSKTGFERLSGTSMASAVAAGVAAMVLAFARQPPLSYAPTIQELLKKPEAMCYVFNDCLSDSKDDQKPFRFLVPRKLFEGRSDDDGDIVGGGPEEVGLARLSAAFMIVKCLEIRYGREKVKPFYDKLNSRG
jgi:subtilisin family serine protease